MKCMILELIKRLLERKFEDAFKFFQNEFIFDFTNEINSFSSLKDLGCYLTILAFFLGDRNKIIQVNINHYIIII